MLRDNLKKTAGVIVAFTVRPVHHGVKGPAGAKIKGQNLGLQGFGHHQVRSNAGSAHARHRAGAGALSRRLITRSRESVALRDMLRLLRKGEPARGADRLSGFVVIIDASGHHQL